MPSFVGFTGTPVDWSAPTHAGSSATTSTSTTLRRPSHDGATVPIYYEARVAADRVEKTTRRDA